MTNKRPAMIFPQHARRWEVIEPDHYWHGHHICDGLYLGSVEASNDYEWLTKHGITTVIRVIHPEEAKLEEYPGITYYQYPMYDGCGDIIKAFKAVQGCIQDALALNGKVLVHCRAGKSRSASIVIAYLMKSRGMCFDDAYNFVSEKRSAIDPCWQFMTDLRSSNFVP